MARGRDPLVDIVGETMDDFAEACVPGKFLVDVAPFCKDLRKDKIEALTLANECQ